MILAFTAALSIAFTWLVIALLHERVQLGADTTSGPQKFHRHSVSRLGGLGIVLALIVFEGYLIHSGSPHAISLGYLLAAGLPALAAGLIEDVTNRAGIATRLAATMLSSGLAMYLLGGVLDHVDVPGLDFLLAFGPIAVLFTIFSVGGIANAINIIDGYNGLSGVVCIMILMSMALVARQVGDQFILLACLATSGALAGFVVWNFPRGRIFLGDGGAYFVGFLIGQLSVLLVSRNPSVSPWFPLMLVAYPVWETFFSIYRKKFLRKMSPGQPDGLHLHMLIYKRLVRVRMFSDVKSDQIVRNSMTSPYLWAVAALGIVPALLWWRHSITLIVCAAVFAAAYGWFYQSIVAFRSPRWLVLHGSHGRTRSQAPDTTR